MIQTERLRPAQPEQETASIGLFYRWVSPVSGGEQVIGMFHHRAYWDDSKSEHICVMAGYFATAHQWEETFDPAWNGVLSRHSVPKAHMTDFVARQGPFKNWSEGLRRRFVDGLLSAIAGAQIRGVAVSVHIEALNRANARWGFNYTPYSVAAALAAESYRNFFGPYETAECFLDRIPKGRTQLNLAEEILTRDPGYRDWWSEERLAWKHLTKPQMQMTIRGKEAADLAAWECMAHAETILGISSKGKGGHWSGTRLSAVELVKAAPLNGLLHSDAELNFLYARISERGFNPLATV
jgi:uncharacterized protein CbrC (UPF0167 family)